MRSPKISFLRTSRFLAPLLLFVMLLPTLFSYAQGIGTGQIEGVVQDPSEAVVPNARIVVRHVATGTERELTTNEMGRYRAVNLRPGEYEVTVEASGFKTVKRSGITVQVGSTATIDITLEVAAVAEVVTVTEDAPITEPSRTEFTATVSQGSVENLPISGRRWENFALLTPTVQPDGDFGLVSYRGISGLYNNNMVDGADNNQAFFSEARGRTRTSYTISQAAIKEFQVGLSNYSAEFGRAVGGTINAVTKSGGNAFHGEAFYFIRDDALNATEPFANAEGHGKLPERRQQFGFSMGGPVVRDKLFWFLNYDQQIRNFPGIAFDEDGFTDSAGRLFIDPSFNLSEICNFSLVGNGNVAQGQARCEGARDLVLSELGPFPRKGHNNVALGKLDWNINPSHTFGVQYNYHKWRSPNGIQTQDRTNDTPNANGFDGVRTDLLLARLTSLISTTTVNEFRFQYGRDFNFQRQNAPGPSVTYNTDIDVDGFGMRDFLPRPVYPDEDRWQFADNFSWVRGRHLIKFGADINYVQEHQINLFQGGGVYDYTVSFTNFASDAPPSLVGGIPLRQDGARTGRHYNRFNQAFDLVTGGISDFTFNTTDWNFYVQDTWKVHPHVTLNFGVRYEYTDTPQPDQSIYACVDAGTCPTFASLPSNLQAFAQQFNRDKNNWGPRVALAWDVGGRQKFIIRTGYGLYYGRTSNSALAAGLFESNGITRIALSMTPTTPSAPQFPNTFCNPPLGTIGETSTCAPPAGATGAVTLNLFTEDYVRPLVHSGELELEYALTSNMSVSASYLMSRGLRLPAFIDINLPEPSDIVTFLDTDGSVFGALPFYARQSGSANFRPIPTFGQIIMSESTVNSWYHALVLRFKRRFSGGLQFDNHFTWSKALDDAQSSTTFFAFFSDRVDPFDRSLEYGPSNFDIRKKWVSHFLWDPPFEKIENRGLRAAFEGFIFSGILTLRDGRATEGSLSFSVPSAIGSTRWGAVSTFTANGSGADNRVPWLGRNFAETTGFANFDFRITREFRIGETMRAVFIWEAFNLFNRVNFNQFGSTAFGANAGCTIVANVCAAGSRTVTSTGLRSNFLDPTAASSTLHGPREMQLGFKFIW